MGANPPSHNWQWPEPLHHLNDFDTCLLCRRNVSPESEAMGGFDFFYLCDDCKFLFLEDHHGLNLEDRQQRRSTTETSTSYDHSETANNIFTQDIRHMMDLMSQNQANCPLLGDQLTDHNSAAMQPHHSSSRTTPTVSRTWPRLTSDTESLELDSVYGGSESNFSVGGSRNFQVESDAISFSAYGAGSDISVDGRSFYDTDLFPQLGNASDFDSDTDIDPMHAGLNNWDSDEDDDTLETDTEDNPVEIFEVPQNPNLSVLRVSDRYDTVTQHRTSEDPTNLRIREDRHSYLADILTNSEESNLPPRADNLGDFMAAAEFEAFLDHLANSESSRQGAPPAAVSVVSKLPRIFVTEEHHRDYEDLACAICKEIMLIDTEVNQLPCIHIYHPNCILPWLRVRNSCPLCRFELPTDDIEYEEKKRMNNHLVQVQHQNSNEDIISENLNYIESSSMITDLPLQGETPETYSAINDSGGELRRGGWLYLAAPIVSIVGLALVLWLGKPLPGRRAIAFPQNLLEPNQHLILHSVAPPNLQRENRRRWWSLF